MIWLLAACLPTETVYEVTITGVVEAAGEGEVYGQVLLTESGSGVLSVSMARVSEFALDGPGEFTLDALVPDQGVGLAVYAWQDTDGDGLLCALDGDEELTGVDYADFPATSASVSIVLDAPCLGPERYSP